MDMLYDCMECAQCILLYCGSELKMNVEPIAVREKYNISISADGLERLYKTPQDTAGDAEAPSVMQDLQQSRGKGQV